MTDKNDDKSKKSGLKLEGEGSYEGSRAFIKEQHAFAKSGQVEKKAREAANALDGPEGEELERARQETKHGAKHQATDKTK